MLAIRDLTVAVEGKDIVRYVNLAIKTGAAHVLSGPNGGGIARCGLDRASGLPSPHTGHILNNVHARTGYVMLDGMIGCAGVPYEMLETIEEKGYEEYVKCLLQTRLR